MQKFASSSQIINAISIIYVCCWANTAGADVALFLPGDSMFSTRVSASILTRRENELILPFRSPRIGPKRYAEGVGIKTLVIPDESLELTTAIQQAYRSIRKRNPRLLRVESDDDGNESIEELNEVDAFVHNTEFAVKRFSPFYRYNENWVRESTGRGGRAVLPGFIPDLEHEEWRDAEDVPPLKQRGRTSSEGVPQIECSRIDVKIFLIASEDLDILTDKSLGKYVDTTSVELLCVEHDKVWRFRLKGEQWKPDGMVGEDDEKP